MNDDMLEYLMETVSRVSTIMEFRISLYSTGVTDKGFEALASGI
jgi:hypothetical protein